ncbi:helix-turn-helix domain-containing protein [Streptomyces filamentosus]|uniref:helix-turn-helix domain-containing protein n=1 Tax=Streptomyces filamentosus TaxID=67294 RepID=UPI00167984D4|nr:helix-turn-helix domain-containing protein [Streptomyces filamentosus]
MKQQFLDLIHEGVSIREASRLVGINRRTGQEWVNGRNERVGTTKPGRTAVRPAVHPLIGILSVGRRRRSSRSTIYQLVSS